MYTVGSLLYFFDYPSGDYIYINVMEIDESGGGFTLKEPSTYNACLNTNEYEDHVIEIVSDASGSIFTRTTASESHSSSYPPTIVDKTFELETWDGTTF